MGAAASGTVAWSPSVDGIQEVYHAHLTGHAYPMHAHASWTLLLVDSGRVAYDLHRHRHGGLRRTVTLLPPHVPHNGTPVTPGGLHKRVLYLDPGTLGEELTGACVDRPELADPLLLRRVGQLHDVLLRAGDEPEAESRFAFVAERLRQHLRHRVTPSPDVRDAPLAHRMRDLLEAHLVEGVPLNAAARALHAHPTHLVRVFGREFGSPPHRYLTGRRVDLARRLLLQDMPVSEVAAAVGFHDQAHLGRHFKRIMGTTPARFARSRPAAGLTCSSARD